MKKGFPLLLLVAIVGGALALLPGSLFSPPVSTDVPIPFSTPKFPLAASVTDLGTKAGRSVVLVRPTNSELLPKGALSMFIAGNDASIKPVTLDRYITAGKKIYGYVYASKNADAEKAAASLAATGVPMTLTELFPGTFFTSSEMRTSSAFINQYEQQHNMRFWSITSTPLPKDSRTVFVAEDDGVYLTVANPNDCGNSVVDTLENCDDGVLGRKDSCGDDCFLTNYWWIDEIASLGPREYRYSILPGTEQLVRLTNGSYSLVWVEEMQDETGARFRELNASTLTPGAGWSPIVNVYRKAVTSNGGYHDFYDLKTILSGNRVLVVWSEGVTSTQGTISTTVTIRSVMYDIDAGLWSDPSSLWTASGNGTTILGLTASDMRHYFYLSANPLSIVWATHKNCEGAKDFMSSIDRCFFDLHLMTYQNDTWSEPSIIGTGQFIYFDERVDSRGNGVYFWSYGDSIARPGCVQPAFDVYVSRVVDGERAAPEVLPHGSWFNLGLTMKQDHTGIITYVDHCETGGYSATNRLYVIENRDGHFATPKLLDTISTGNYSGAGTIETSVNADGTFTIRWTESDSNAWTPRAYNVTVGP